MGIEARKFEFHPATVDVLFKNRLEYQHQNIQIVKPCSNDRFFLEISHIYTVMAPQCSQHPRCKGGKLGNSRCKMTNIPRSWLWFTFNRFFLWQVWLQMFFLTLGAIPYYIKHQCKRERYLEPAQKGHCHQPCWFSSSHLQIIIYVSLRKIWLESIMSIWHPDPSIHQE